MKYLTLETEFTVLELAEITKSVVEDVKLVLSHSDNRSIISSKNI